MTIKLPALVFDKPYGSNWIYHTVEDEFQADFTLSELTRHFAILRSEKFSCCITWDELHFKSECEYILLANKKLSQSSIEAGKLHFKRWLKHPKLKNYDPEVIRSSWRGAFNYIEEDIQQGTPGLRTPQVGALHAALGHLPIADEIGTVVLPTGTGKTETMLSILIANRCPLILVTVPTDPLRDQISDKFIGLGYLKKFGIVTHSAVNPIVGVLTSKFASIEELQQFFSKCNVVVSTMSIVAGSKPDEISKMAEVCSHLFVDEAHHSKAASWNKFIETFSKNKVLLFTATPYRNDGQRLDGKIIFNFLLRKAQEQGYFKPIEFIPIREYDPVEADKKIADRAVEKLREDRAAGFDHILMARCEDKERARTVFKLYESHADMNPVLVHSTVPGKKNVLESIKSKRHFIIVCVDMLGEGFDLPELKIAAFHDIRKSLPITLQFAGRFTRTSRDAHLGTASFVANLYQPDVTTEIEDLYAQDTDWNLLLPKLSAKNVQDQIDVQEFLAGFPHLTESKIPFQNIEPALSTVVYRNRTNEWSPRNFTEGIKDYKKYDYKFHDLNSGKKTLVILLGRKKDIQWGNFNDVYDIEWNLIIVFWESRNNLLFIHGSEKSGLYQDMAKAILGEDNFTIISGMDVFKVFHNIHRLALFNVGLRKGQGKNLSFQSYYGKSVGEALNYLQRRQGIKNNIFGIGYENGEKTSLGCSQKGRIWSYSRGDIRDLTLWCTEVGKKLVNPNIDPDTVLKGTLIPKLVSQRPVVYPVSVDWDADLYRISEERIEFRIQNKTYDLATSELKIYNGSIDGPLQFAFCTDDFEVVFQIDLSQRGEEPEIIYETVISKISGQAVTVAYGAESSDIAAFFTEHTPVIWFADGSNLKGNMHININEEILPYPKEGIEVFDWNGVNLSNESQHVNPIITDSIQYALIQKLILQDYLIVYDDDYSGEIADVIGIMDTPTEIEVHLYHLKWAIDGLVSNQIKNLYEVCGQAQKSVNWKYRESRDFFNHLLKRETKKRNGQQRSRLEKGSTDDLEMLLRVSKSLKPTTFYIYIVQPAISQLHASDDILLLLGVTANYLKDVSDINLKVIGSA